MSDLFDGFDVGPAIESAARAHGLDLCATDIDALARHAREVAADERLHLSSIREPAEFVARHVEESFAGAAALPADATGLLVDLGSGNGYPGLPVVVARPGLHGLLVDSSPRRTEFLSAATSGLARLEVRCAHVQRPADVPDIEHVRVLTVRAVGGWQKVVPRLACWLGTDGEMLLWAGAEVESVASRVAWRRFDLVEQRPLEGRERSWIWRFRRARG